MDKPHRDSRRAPAPVRRDREIPLLPVRERHARERELLANKIAGYQRDTSAAHATVSVPPDRRRVQAQHHHKLHRGGIPHRDPDQRVQHIAHLSERHVSLDDPDKQFAMTYSPIELNARHVE